MRTGNYIAAVLLFGLVGLVWILTAQFPVETSNIPGADFFPRLVSGVLAVLVILMLLENRNCCNESICDFGSAGFRRALSLLALTVTYVFLLGVFGFLVMTPICLLSMMLLMEKGKVLVKSIAAAATTGILFLVFEVLLSVPLPAWSL